MLYFSKKAVPFSDETKADTKALFDDLKRNELLRKQISDSISEALDIFSGLRNVNDKASKLHLSTEKRLQNSSHSTRAVMIICNNLRKKMTFSGELLHCLLDLMKFFERTRLSIDAHIESKQDLRRLAVVCSHKNTANVRAHEKLRETSEELERVEEANETVALSLQQQQVDLKNLRTEVERLRVNQDEQEMALVEIQSQTYSAKQTVESYYVDLSTQEAENHLFSEHLNAAATSVIESLSCGLNHLSAYSAKYQLPLEFPVQPPHLVDLIYREDRLQENWQENVHPLQTVSEATLNCIDDGVQVLKNSTTKLREALNQKLSDFREHAVQLGKDITERLNTLQSMQYQIVSLGKKLGELAFPLAELEVELGYIEREEHRVAKEICISEEKRTTFLLEAEALEAEITDLAALADELQQKNSPQLHHDQLKESLNSLFKVEQQLEQDYQCNLQELNKISDSIEKGLGSQNETLLLQNARCLKDKLNLVGLRNQSKRQNELLSKEIQTAEAATLKLEEIQHAIESTEAEIEMIADSSMDEKKALEMILIALEDAESAKSRDGQTLQQLRSQEIELCTSIEKRKEQMSKYDEEQKRDIESQFEMQMAEIHKASDSLLEYRNQEAKQEAIRVMTGEAASIQAKIEAIQKECEAVIEDMKRECEEEETKMKQQAVEFVQNQNHMPNDRSKSSESLTEKLTVKKLFAQIPLPNHPFTSLRFLTAEDVSKKTVDGREVTQSNESDDTASVRTSSRRTSGRFRTTTPRRVLVPILGRSPVVSERHAAMSSTSVAPHQRPPPNGILKRTITLPEEQAKLSADLGRKSLHGTMVKQQVPSTLNSKARAYTETIKKVNQGATRRRNGRQISDDDSLFGDCF